MRRLITRAQAIRYALYAILAVMILSIFPLRLIKEDISTHGLEQPSGAVTVGGDKVVLQQFNAEYDHISSIGVYIKGDYYDDTLTLRVFKQANSALLREVTVSVDDLKRVDERTYKSGSGEGYADVFINLDTEVGEGYFYTLEGVSTDFEVLFEMTGNSGAANNGLMQYADENKEAYNVMTRYTYTQPLRKVLSLIIIGALTVLGVALTFLINFLEKKIPALQDLCTIRWIIRIIANPLIVIGAVTAIVFIGPLHVFSIFVSDIVILIAGVLILAGLLLYAVNGRWYEDAEPVRIDAHTVQSLAQSVCIALAMWACVEYMNALYEVFHDIAWRKMAFFLGLGIVVTFSFKELVNIYNAVLLIGGVIAARLYYVRNLPDMVDEYHTEAMLWTCRLIPLILILIAYFVMCLTLAVRDRRNPLGIVSLPYTVACILMGAGLIVRRHHEYWPILAFVIAAVYAVRFLFWDQRERFIAGVLNACLIHFGACVVFCLLHRPFASFRYVRYPLVFHTVTITAEYMALIMCAALVKLFAKYRRTKDWHKCIPEMCIAGVVSVYMLFTMSRTAMIGVVSMGLVIWFAYSFRDAGRARIRSLTATALMLVASVFVCFPVVFTAQRILPAVIAEPRFMEIEEYHQDLQVCDDIGSEEFITISKFTKIFCHKMFGLDEDLIKLDAVTIYGRRDDVYLDRLELYNSTTDASVSGSGSGYACGTGGIMLSGEQLMSDDNGGFVPPHEYTMEGEPPEQWWDINYWALDPATGEWVYEYWKVQAEENDDVSNGRLDIFRSYYEQLTPEGHEEMGATLPNGEIAAHAHNIYLQVAYDGGIIIGIMFIIWCACTCAQALMVFLRLRRFDPSAGMVLAVSVMYAVCGLTEWISHPCNPVGMILLLIIVPLALSKYEPETDETV